MSGPSEVQDQGQGGAGARPTEQGHRLYQLAVDFIYVDPDRFQARSEFEEDATGSDLSDVTVFNADFAGVISVWLDPQDRLIYVVDGHRRLDLARRTGTPEVLVQYLSYPTAGEAFGMGILLHIAGWVFDSNAKIEMACRCRREALVRAFEEQRLDPSSEIAEQLFESFPDLRETYGSPTKGI